MKCPHCHSDIDGYRGRFSTATTLTVLTMYYKQKKSIYAIVKYLAEKQVKTNKMTLKKVISSYDSSWSDYLERNAHIEGL